MLLEGRKVIIWRMVSMQSSSSSQAKWATPLLVAWTVAPPRSSMETSSWVTVFTTSGPVMNMWLVFFTMKMKSVRAGL